MENFVPAEDLTQPLPADRKELVADAPQAVWLVRLVDSEEA